MIKTTKEFAKSVISGFADINLKNDKAVFLKAFGHYNKGQQVNFVVDVILKGLKKIGAILIKIMLKALKNLGSPVKLVIGINGFSIPSVQFIIDKKLDVTALSGKDIIDVIQKNA